MKIKIELPFALILENLRSVDHGLPAWLSVQHWGRKDRSIKNGPIDALILKIKGR